MSVQTLETVDQDLSNCASESLPDTIRVLHLINGEYYSGAERVQDLLGLRLGEFGFEVGFACLKPGRFPLLRRANDAELYDVAMRSRFDYRPVASLAKIIRDNKYQIVHTHTSRSALIGALAAAICRVPHVHHLHSPTAMDTTRWLTNRANMAIEWLSLRRADAVIAVSHSLGEYAKAHKLNGGLVQVVPNGVPTQGPLQERPTPAKTWTLGSVALFRPRKGLEVLIEALARLREQGLRVRLRAVGAFETASYEVRIKTLADKLGVTNAIDWVGFTNDVSAELAKMDIFVLPSLFGEGLPMVILEAMAAGVPIVATRVEGAPEAIRDTLDGLLAEPNDAVDLATRIADIAEGRLDWQSLRKSAHERQAQRFSDVSMARGVADVYRQVLASRKSMPQGTTASGETPTFDRITLMGTPIDNATMPDAIATIKQRLGGNEPTQVCFVNADCMNITYRDPAYRQVLADADFVFADGVGMKIAGKVLGQPIRENVNGTDLFPRLCMALAKSGTRIFLLGGRAGVADSVGRWITSHFPGLNVCGIRDGYFPPNQESAVIHQIAESDADLLLVAFGAPRQDRWIHDHLAELGCKTAIGVGGLFDFLSGRVSRAPRWMQKCGLEWLFRLSQEPRRLAKRYLLGNPLFLYRVAREKVFGQRIALASSNRVAWEAETLSVNTSV